jgi:hypothetical protein
MGTAQARTQNSDDFPDGTVNTPHFLHAKGWHLADTTRVTTAAEWAAAQVERVRDDPAGLDGPHVLRTIR